MWFKGLINTDLSVPNTGQMLDALVDRLGFERPDVGLAMGQECHGEDGVYRPAGTTAEIAFARLSPWTLEYFEVISMGTHAADAPVQDVKKADSKVLDGAPGGWMKGTTSPVARTVDNHEVTGGITDEDLLDLVGHWDKVGVPYVVIEPSPAQAIPSIFIGVGGDPFRFHPELVVLPWEWAGPALFELTDPARRAEWTEIFEERLAAVPRPVVASGTPPEGALTQIVSRAFLVSNLEESLDLLGKNMKLDPGPDELTFETFKTFKSARITPKPDPSGALWSASPGLPGSPGAVLELRQPTSEEGRTGEQFATHGPGHLAIRLGTDSLGACCEELDRRGTRWTNIDDEPEANRILVDPSQFFGAQIEIEQF